MLQKKGGGSLQGLMREKCLTYYCTHWFTYTSCTLKIKTNQSSLSPQNSWFQNHFTYISRSARLDWDKGHLKKYKKTKLFCKVSVLISIKKIMGTQYHLFHYSSIIYSMGNILYLINLADRQNIFPKNNSYYKDAYEEEALKINHF